MVEVGEKLIDENKRHNFNVSYIYAPDSAWLAFAKLNLDYQKN